MATHWTQMIQLRQVLGGGVDVQDDDRDEAVWKVIEYKVTIDIEDSSLAVTTKCDYITCARIGIQLIPPLLTKDPYKKLAFQAHK